LELHTELLKDMKTSDFSCFRKQMSPRYRQSLPQLPVLTDVFWFPEMFGLRSQQGVNWFCADEWSLPDHTHTNNGIIWHLFIHASRGPRLALSQARRIPSNTLPHTSSLLSHPSGEAMGHPWGVGGRSTPHSILLPSLGHMYLHRAGIVCFVCHNTLTCN
jgi:hypothetical protein